MAVDTSQKPFWHRDVAKLSRVPLEPSRSWCDEHGWQDGPGCSDCWDQYGAEGAPPKPETMNETQKLQAQVADLQNQLNQFKQQSDAARAEFNQVQQQEGTPYPGAPNPPGTETQQ